MGSVVAWGARRLLRGLGRVQGTATGGVSVLAYHLVDGGTASPVDLPGSLFERHLDGLSALGRVVPLERALERLNTAHESSDEQWIVLTFDDAFRNFYEVVWPRLEERRLPATLYAPTGFIDGASPSPLSGAEALPPLSWPQLRELAASTLLTIGSHSVHHPDLRSLDTESCRRELRLSRQRLEDETGRSVDSFCYPRALWSRSVRTEVARVYGCGVIAGGRRNRAGRCDPHALSRLPLRRDMPATIADLLSKPVWLEEWAASGFRRLLSR